MGWSQAPRRGRGRGNQFLGNDLDNAPPRSPKLGRRTEAEAEATTTSRTSRSPNPTPAPLVDFAGPARRRRRGLREVHETRRTDLPIFYPTQIVETHDHRRHGGVARRRAARAERQDDLLHVQVRDPVPGGLRLSYYGLSGTNWEEPPILKNPSEYRTIDGREYMLFYEQDRLRLVGWQTNKGSYWVINTLTHALSEEAMLEVATSAQELGE